MKRFPCLLRIKYASSQHCRNLSIHKEHLLWSGAKTSGPDPRQSGLVQYRVIWTGLDLTYYSYLVPLNFLTHHLFPFYTTLPIQIVTKLFAFHATQQEIIRKALLSPVVRRKEAKYAKMKQQSKFNITKGQLGNSPLQILDLLPSRRHEQTRPARWLGVYGVAAAKPWWKILPKTLL